MKIKKEFELIYHKGTDRVYNIVPLSKNTLKAYTIDKIDENYLIGLINTYIRMKPNKMGEIVRDNAKKCIVVNMPEYPLPGFLTKNNLPVINLHTLPVTVISDYSPVDIFSLYLYSLSLMIFVKNKSFKDGSEINVGNMLFSIFMKMFGKKSGLIGAFRDLIPTLQFLIMLYVTISMMGKPQNKNLIDKIASKYYRSTDNIKLDYDFSSIIDLLKSINENKIIAISEYKFSSTVISMGKMQMLPIFEDISRFYATVLASNITGNTQFNYFIAKTHAPLFKKLTDYAISELKRYNK